MKFRAPVNQEAASAFGYATEPHRRKLNVRGLAARVWWIALAALLIPAMTAWTLRGFAYVLHCAPRAESCLQGPFQALLGAALKGMLDFSWLIGANFAVTMLLTLLAGLAAIVAQRPIAAALTVLLAPLVALLLPVALIGTISFAGCTLSNSSACVLWGRNMGATFQHAATAPELLYAYTPLAVAGALVAGLLGMIVQWGCRQMDRGA